MSFWCSTYDNKRHKQLPSGFSPCGVYLGKYKHSCKWSDYPYEGCHKACDWCAKWSNTHFKEHYVLMGRERIHKVNKNQLNRTLCGHYRPKGVGWKYAYDEEPNCEFCERVVLLEKLGE